MEKRFTGKVVLVTGSSKGIGRATAIEFAKEGAVVVINCTASIDRALEVVSCIETLGGKAVFVQCNVADEEQVKSMVRDVINKLGKIDVLVNNAGVTRQSNFLNLSIEDFRKTLDTNLLGTFSCSKYVAREMISKNKGKIVNVASIRGLENCARKDMMDYSVAKAGVISLTKSLAKELTPMGINVNAVAPGITRTDLAKHLSEDAQRMAIDGALIKRMAEPEEIARAILFLASSDADYITGEVLVVDAGYNLTKL